MLNSKRSEIDIIGQILDIAKEGAQKVDIYYDANLSYKQLSYYIPGLIEKDLLEIKPNSHGNNSNKIYNTTKKGNELLKNINKVSSFLK